MFKPVYHPYSGNAAAEYRMFPCNSASAITEGELVIVVGLAYWPTAVAIGTETSLVPGGVIPWRVTAGPAGIPAGNFIWGIAAESRSASTADSFIKVYVDPNITFRVAWYRGATAGGTILTASGGSGTATWTLVDATWTAPLNDQFNGSKVIIESNLTNGTGAFAVRGQRGFIHTVSDYVAATGTFSLLALGTGGAYAATTTTYRVWIGNGFLSVTPQPTSDGLNVDLNDVTMATTAPVRIVGVPDFDPTISAPEVHVRLTHNYNTISA